MSSTSLNDIDAALQAHDLSVAATAPPIWLGAEPTFTDRRSEAPEWLRLADGGDKSARALAMLANLARGGLLLRTLGRQYGGEDLPRWSFGLYQGRDGHPVWLGPADPAQGGAPSPRPVLESFVIGLNLGFAARGWNSRVVPCQSSLEWRIAFRVDGLPCPTVETDERLTRPSIHNRPIPEEGIADSLAAEGIYLLVVSPERVGGDETLAFPRLELPAFPTVRLFLDALEVMGRAASEAGLAGLILTGFPPPVDGSIAWTTITPDPAVIEVNMAPVTTAVDFLVKVREIYRAAADKGLSACRFHYNGDVTDSGGGGQITFGGPTPKTSPFFLRPWLLPNLIRYCNRHPALSYFFTPTCVGSTSQSPRPDERYRESFDELRLALDLLGREESPTPEILSAALGPFLTDVSGNSHRSEINIEKLWNPSLLGRGCLGLVEFRAFRMAPSPESLAARAALFRAVIAMLARRPESNELIDWGAELHQRFALPYYLKQDLLDILAELEGAGLGLRAPIPSYLLNDEYRVIGDAAIGDARVTVRRALEFWPLAGDSAAAERSPSRLIDSSTFRIEMTLRLLAEGDQPLEPWQISVGDWRVPVRCERDRQGQVLLFGLRYRGFIPWRGLHPTLGVQTPVEVMMRRRDTGQAWRLALHEWKPEGGGYEGLPDSQDECRRRRQERLVVDFLDITPEPAYREPPPLAVNAYGLDLRACPAPHSLGESRRNTP
jgi:uncharacterized protein (DUF2126 family)